MITLSTNVSEGTVHVFGAFVNDLSSASCITTALGYSGLSGSNTSGALFKGCASMATYGFGGHNIHAAMHALTVTVVCTGNAMTSEGTVHAATLRSVFRRKTYTTFNDLANATMSRPETKARSAYELLGKPMVMVSHPIDVTDWSLQMPIVDPTAQEQNRISDKLAPIVIVFQPTSVPVSYNITIHTEWRVNFSDVGLASTAVPRPVSSPAFWQNAGNIVREVAGHVEDLAGAGKALMSAVSVGTKLLKPAMKVLG